MKAYSSICIFFISFLKQQTTSLKPILSDLFHRLVIVCISVWKYFKVRTCTIQYDSRSTVSHQLSVIMQCSISSIVVHIHNVSYEMQYFNCTVLKFSLLQLPQFFHDRMSIRSVTYSHDFLCNALKLPFLTIGIPKTSN